MKKFAMIQFGTKAKIIKCLIFVTLLFYKSELSSQVNIPSNFYGLNFWMPDTIGSLVPNGKFDLIWASSPNEVTNSQIKLVRFGGTDFDRVFPSDHDFKSFVLKCRGYGLEPLIQIPFVYNLIPYTTSANQYIGQSLNQSINWVLDPSKQYQSTGNSYKARVQTLVNLLKVSPYNVKYWCISNEPDRWNQNLTKLSVSNPPPNPVALDISDYFTNVSDWIKDSNCDPNAIVIGPDFASSNSSGGSGSLFNQLFDDQYVNGPGINGVSAATSKRHCDIWAYHTYPFDGTSSQTRSAIIDQPANTTAGFASRLNIMNGIANNPNRNSNPNFMFAVTEFNVDHENPSFSPCNSPDFVCNDIQGTGPNSFLAGQWMAEMFARGIYNDMVGPPMAFMVPWSLHESSGNPSSSGDIGLLNAQWPNVQRRSTYVHLKLLAEFFSQGTFEWTSLNFGPSDPLVKCFAAYGCGMGGAAVMILNQNLTTKSYSLRLNNDTPGLSDYSGNFPGMAGFLPTNGDAVALAGTVGGEETLVYIIDSCGDLIYKYSYTRSINQSSYSDPVLLNTPPTSICGCQ
jgi:hypothetical protein